MTTYETIRYNEEGLEGSTFGCSCCSAYDSVSSEDVLSTARMYKEKADRYFKMAELLRTCDVQAIYKAWIVLQEAENRLEGAMDYSHNPEKCGTWQKEMYEEIGIDNLEKSYCSAKMYASLFEEMDEVARIFQW